MYEVPRGTTCSITHDIVLATLLFQCCVMSTVVVHYLGIPSGTYLEVEFAAGGCVDLGGFLRRPVPEVASTSSLPG